MKKDMRVKDLVKLLKTLPQDSLVVLSKDSEGNSFSPLPGEYNYSTGLFVRDDRLPYYGDVYSDEDIKEDRIDPEDGEACVVLWPSN